MGRTEDRRLRGFIAGAVAIAAGMFGGVVAEGLIGAWGAALAGFAVVAALVGWWLARGGRGGRGVLAALDAGACPRALKIGALIATVVALVQLGRLAVFAIDPARVEASVLPSSEWEQRHWCASSYFVAAEAVDRVPNVYADALYSVPNADPGARRTPRMMGPFRVDVFEYPTPFLLLPRAVALVTPDYLRFRSVWFGLNGAAALVALVALAGLLAPPVRTRALLSAPLVFAAFPMASVLQKGNVQVLVVACAMLAMMQLDRRRYALGGALLAFATVSKLYPGMLVVYLLARRDWRAVGWTLGWGAVIVAASVLDTGWRPLVAFVDHLPGLLGGEAFPALKVPAPIAINYSIPGVVLKLKLFGVAGMSFDVAKVVGWIYTLGVLAATVYAARRVDDTKVVVWLAILTLATLRSPFLPQSYASYPPIWLLTFLAAAAAPTPRTLGLVLAIWVGLNVFVPIDAAIDPRWTALIVVVPQALVIGLAVFALRRTSRVRHLGVPLGVIGSSSGAGPPRVP